MAKATELAADKDVGVNGGEIARQCVDAGQLDEVHVDLVPVFLDSGIPLLGMIKDASVELDGPISVTQGTGVTHLGYRVVRNQPSRSGRAASAAGRPPPRTACSGPSGVSPPW